MYGRIWPIQPSHEPFGDRPPRSTAMGNRWKESWKPWTARLNCLRLFWHLARAAASRTFWTAGSNRPMRMAMIAITTNNSISVKAARLTGKQRFIRSLMKMDSPQGHPGTAAFGVNTARRPCDRTKRDETHVRVTRRRAGGEGVTPPQWPQGGQRYGDNLYRGGSNCQLLFSEKSHRISAH